MDTFLDQQSGYFFEMNPFGLMADAVMGPGGSNNRQWDGIWDARVVRSEIGWTLEIAIPFRTLNFDPGAPAWGINFQRTVQRKSEESLWTGMPHPWTAAPRPSSPTRTASEERGSPLGSGRRRRQV
jgi:hypothetical protein